MHLVTRKVLITLILCLFSVTFVHAQLVQRRGSDTTIDIATWNLKQFPLTGATTTTLVGLMVGDLELDVIGLQEIVDVDALNQAAQTAGGWSALTTQPYAGDIRIGVLYKNSKVDLTGAPYVIIGNQFTRNPYVIPMEVTENETTIAFNLVVVHLKAYNTPDDIQTRRIELGALKDFIDPQLGDEPNWIVVGDFNDELDDPESWNVFLDFLDDDNYEFLTLPMAGDPQQASYPGYSSLIDHILITSSLLDEYGDNGLTETLRLDDELSNYLTTVSDHRPVASYFPATDAYVGESWSSAQPALPTITLWPVPSNASVTVRYELPGRAAARMYVYDLLGRVVAQQALASASGRVVWDAQTVPSGMYVVKVEGGDGQSVQARAVVLK